MGEGVPDEIARLARIAHALGRRASGWKSAPADARSWPTLWLFTDPDRTPDLLAAAARLPRDAGLVLRTFGRSEVDAQAPALMALARRRGLVVLVGADDRLAARLGADGVHLPQRLVAVLPRLRARHPAWRFTVAAHGAASLRRAARAGADAAFLSPVLPSLSPSAGSPLGAVRTAALVRMAGLPVFGLGGIDGATAQRLAGAGLAGLAGVSFAEAGR